MFCFPRSIPGSRKERLQCFPIHVCDLLQGYRLAASISVDVSKYGLKIFRFMSVGPLEEWPVDEEPCEPRVVSGVVLYPYLL